MSVADVNTMEFGPNAALGRLDEIGTGVQLDFTSGSDDTEIEAAKAIYIVADAACYVALLAATGGDATVANGVQLPAGLPQWFYSGNGGFLTVTAV